MTNRSPRASARSSSKGAAGRILIVEDEKDLVRIIQRRLEHAGYEVLAAASAESALKAVRETPPAMILLDIALPAMDGISFLRLLRRESAVPVILVSGRCSDVDRIIGLKAGADDFIGKPFSLNELVARVECLLRRQAKTAAPKGPTPSA
jgi:DNA-binding response OmpR family regulator